MLEVEKKTTIDASRDEVWAALSTLSDYGEWNPIIRRVDGTLTPGSTLTIHVEGPAGARPWDVTVTTVEPRTAYGWRFQEHTSWLYRGEHLFRLEDSPDGVVFLDRERFRGLLVPFRARRLRASIAASMDQMSVALRARTESGAAAPEGQQK